MLAGFPDHTKRLTEKEINTLVPEFVRSFQKRIGKSNAVTSTEIIEGFKIRYNIEISDSTVRKIVNHIRNNNLLPGLVANSSGYYITHDPSEIKRYVESLQGRENAIRKVRESMINHLKHLQSRKQGQ